MNTNKIVNPSDQTQALLPLFVGENYQTFVNFMAKASESEERVGFGQDLLQNLLKYRDVNTYSKGVVVSNTLAASFDETEEDTITLIDGRGFPLQNGVILIDDEVILYRERNGNNLENLTRGAKAAVVLPSVVSDGKYVDGPAQKHTKGSEVQNISSLFLNAILGNIHDSFTPNIHRDKVNENVDRTILLQNIRDFYGAKGSKLGVQALFKFIYGENDVDVVYPGDKIARPSASAWQEFVFGHAVPFPLNFLPADQSPLTKENLLGSRLDFKTIGSENVVASAICEFSTIVNGEDGLSFDIYVDKDSISGNSTNIATPTNVLKRDLIYYNATSNIKTDVTAVTVDSTLGFPDSGLIFIGTEGIRYTHKSHNQFLGCSRAVMGLGSTHRAGSVVYGQNYVEITLGAGQKTRCWVSELLQSVTINDGGLLNEVTDPIFIGEPGDTEPRELIMSTVIENTTDDLVQQYSTSEMTDVSDTTAGISAVYYDKDKVYLASSNLPNYYAIGPFSNDGSVGSELKEDNDSLHVIPRTTQTPTTKTKTGSGMVGVFADGTPALSVRNGSKLVSGEIISIDVINGGAQYDNATVVIDGDATATATITDGTITAVTVDSNANYTSEPTARISTGEGATFNLTFDQYGRLVNVIITYGGDYYYDVPALVLDDGTGRGSGAVLTCTVDGLGRINGVTIVNSGIDYSASSSTLRAVTRGIGAELKVNVQSYNYNRYEEFDASATLQIDSGNGIVDTLTPGGTRDTFGYVARPDQLIDAIGDTVGVHSKIIGWAYDGNPIYGPQGYLNGVDASEGIVTVASGYVLRADRSAIVPEGSSTVGTLPPDTGTYPMGTFIEDYVFNPGIVAETGQLQTEFADDLQTETSDNIQYQSIVVAGVLDEYNGRLCNTPEFPASEYPDGVYCFFVSTLGGEPQFPYIIGSEFRDLPITQNLNINKGRGYTSTQSGLINYTDAVIDVDYNTFDRNSNGSIPSNKNKPEVSINKVLPGTVSGVVGVVDGVSNATIEDQFYFDNTGTDGDGARARVRSIRGQSVVSGVARTISTNVLSHNQRINLSEDANAENYVFVEGTTLQTNQDTTCIVKSWDLTSKYLDVNTTSERLIRFGDKIFDSSGTAITISASKFPSNTLMSTEFAGLRSTHASWIEPDNDVANPGDIWWSSRTGRLYVYYNDGDSSQWVTTTPSGSRSFVEYSTDEPVSTTTPTTQSFSTPQDQTAISMSTMAPSSRADGSPNQSGDLWWSTYTGMLYIWAVENPTDDDTSTLDWGGQWIATDPSATTGTDQGTAINQMNNVTAVATTYTQSVNVLISEASPATMSDGSTLVPGTLWWSPASGKMYIYYTDADTSQWVTTNPTTNISGPRSLDTLITNDGSGPDYISLLPVPADQSDVWFEATNDPTNDWKVGDVVEFFYGAPEEGNRDTATITEVLAGEGYYRVSRSETPIEILHGATVTNISRSQFIVTTSAEHNLKDGNTVIVSGASSDAVNGEKTVVKAGKCVPAQFTATITGDTVTNITIDSPGSGYDGNFYLSGSGGEGFGLQALALANGISGIAKTVSVEDVGTGGWTPGITYNVATTAVEGSVGSNLILAVTADGSGEVTSVEITNKGENYLVGDFVILTGGNGDTRVEVEAITSVPVGTVYDVIVQHGGTGYTSAPTVRHTTPLTTYQFQLDITGEAGEDDNGISYSTTAAHISGTPDEVVMLSGGLNYFKLPKVRGLIRSQRKQAKAEAVLTGTSIGSIKITKPGYDYQNPVVNIVDITGAGSGATAVATINSVGSVASVLVTNPGTNYVEPVIEFIEEVGTYLAVSNDIGRIASCTVDSSGAPQHSDYIATPEVHNRVRLVINYDSGSFLDGEKVYQGSADDRLSEGTVVGYDEFNQTLLLEQVTGTIVAGEPLLGESTFASATVYMVKQADLHLEPSTFSNPYGKFVNEVGNPSSKSSVIHDSYYYQHFSYVISSPLNVETYEPIVNKITHPSGFIMFGELVIDGSVTLETTVEPAYVGDA